MIAEIVAAIPEEWIYEGAALVVTAGIAYLRGKQVGKRALATLDASRTAFDVVCDSIADGSLSADEAKNIVAACKNVAAAAEGRT